MEIVVPEPPVGQFFLLRHHLSDVFSRSRFDGESWGLCAQAFLAVPGVPVLGQNFATQAPASYFYRLFERQASDPAEPENVWDRLLGQLASLGERQVTQLLISDQTRSWVLFLSDDLAEVLAFGSRPLPGPKYSLKQDEDDLQSGSVIRQVLGSENAMTVTKLDHSFPDATVELIDDSGARYSITFERALRINTPEPANEEVAGLFEIAGSTGRKWFVFKPSRDCGGRALTVQATSVSWRVIGP